MTITREVLLFEPVGISLCRHIASGAFEDGCLLPLYSTIYPISLVHDPKVRLSLFISPYNLYFLYEKLFSSELIVAQLRDGYNKMVRQAGAEGDIFTSLYERKIIFYITGKNAQGFFFAEYRHKLSSSCYSSIHYGCVQLLSQIL